MEMKHVACMIAVILAVVATVSCSSKQSEDLLKLLDNLQTEIGSIKRDQGLDDEAVEAENSISKRLAKWRDPKRPLKKSLSEEEELAVEAENSISKRLAKWRDPKRPMLHSMDNYLKKKSLSEEEELANEKSDTLMRLMVRALLDEKRK